MDNVNRYLLYLLVFQVLLSAVVFYNFGKLSASPEPSPLISIQKADISKIILKGPSDTSVTLTKKVDSWVLPKEKNFPANNAAVEQLLGRLFDLKEGVQVSQQETSFARLRVSDKDFERQIMIYKDGELSEVLFFGTAAALRQTHVRRGGETKVFSVKFAAGDIELQSSDWLKRDIFVFPSEHVQEVSIGSIKISNKMVKSENAPDNIESSTSQKKQWGIKDLKKNMVPSQVEINDLVRQLADIQVSSLASPDDIKNIDRSKKPIEFKISLKNNVSHTFKLLKLKNEDDFLLRASSREETFRMPPLSAKQLVNKAKRDVLTISKK